MSQMPRNSSCKALPLFGKEAPDLLSYPLYFALRGGGQGTEDQCTYAIGMRVGVGQSEGRTPGQTHNGPAINFVQLAQRFDVRNQMGRCIGTEVRVRLICQRSTAARSSLIEQYSAI